MASFVLLVLKVKRLFSMLMPIVAKQCLHD